MKSKLFSVAGVTGLAAFFAACQLPAESMAAASPLVSTELRCEYLVNPIGIDEPAPRLSWKLTTNSSERAQVQTASHILAASSLALLEKNKGDLWDVELAGSATTQVVYAGKPLAPHTQVFWKVQVVDGEKRRSEWSAPAQ